MIINIICIIYNRLKFTTYKLYLTIVQLLYFLIWIILTLYTYKILCLSKTTIHSYKFAFNINIIYLSENFRKCQVIQKIQIEHYNSVFIKKFIANNKYLFNINFLNKLNIKNKIEILKNYGFLKQVKLLFIKSSSIKYITLNFTLNPILKTVKITKQKKLLIPKKVLVNIFYRQIGLPKNYIHINQSIQDIYSWYQSRGFNWVNIKLVGTKNTEEIYLKICEGRIVRSSINCVETDIVPYIIRRYTEDQINKKLGFTTNQILNIRRLEYDIKSLKISKILKDCNYSVIRNHNGINVLFQYSLLKSHSGFFSKQETVFNNDKNIFLIYKYYIYRYKQLSFKIHRKISYNCYKQIIKSYYPLKSIFFKIKDRIKFYIQLLSQNFTLRYYLYNYQQNFTIDIYINNQNIDTNISFFVPNISFSNCSFNYTIVNFYYRYYKSNLLNYIQTLHLLNSYRLRKEIIYTKILLVGFDVSLKKNIDKYIYLKVKFASQFNKSNQRLVNIINYSQNNFYVNIERKLMNIFLERIIKSIKQSLLNIKITINYNTLYLAQQIKSGQLYIIELVYLIPLLLDTSFNIYKIQSAKQNFYFTYNQSYVLPKLVKHIYNHLIFIIIKIDCLVSKKNYIGILNKNSFNIFIASNNINCHLVKPLYLYRLEYSIYIFSNLSSYIFCSFAQNLNSCNKHKFLYLNQLNKLCNFEINIGCGIQFNIPIYKLPTFRIEYKLSNIRNNFLQIRLYSQYND